MKRTAITRSKEPKRQPWTHEAPAKMKSARTFLATISPTSKRGRETREYLRQRIPWLALHPVCQYPGCVREATQVHHKARRRLGAMLDTDTWMAVCSWCHRIIHDDEKAAEAQGFIIRNYKPKIISQQSQI